MKRVLGTIGMILAIIAALTLVVFFILGNTLANQLENLNPDDLLQPGAEDTLDGDAQGEEEGPTPEEVINHYRVEFSKVSWFDDYNRIARTDPLTFRDAERQKATGLTFAPGFPLDGDTDEARLGDIVDRDMREPITGASRVHAMVHDDTFRIFNVHVTEIFPQLKTFDDKYMEWMAMPSDADVTNGTEFLYYAVDKETVEVSEEYREVGKILAFLDTEVATAEGVKSKMTSRDNYPLVKAATDDLRYCAPNTTQESGDVFLFEIKDEKTGQVFYKYGFNVKDCRYEVFDLKAKGETPKEDPPKKQEDPPKKQEDKQEDPGGGGKPTGGGDPGGGGKPSGGGDPGGGSNPGGGGDPGGGGKKPTDGDGTKDKGASSISQWDPDSQKPNDNKGPGTQNQDERKETKPVEKVEDAILPSTGSDDPGYNSGAGPTGTTDTKSDVDPEDAHKESNIPSSNIVNDTPATVDTTRGEDPAAVAADNGVTDTGQHVDTSTENEATDNWDGGGFGF